MKASPGKTSGYLILLLITLPLANAQIDLQTTRSIQSQGLISQLQLETISVDPNTIIGTNKLSLGFQLTYGALTKFPVSTEYQELAKDANFKMVRIFDYQLKPCSYWNETTKQGNFNWEKTDSLIRSIYAIGCEPLINLVHCGGGPTFMLPPGMQLNSTTGLPNKESYAAYCREWVLHFKTVGLPVKYYELINEIQFYIFNGQWTWTNDTATRTGYYMQLSNQASAAMRQVNNNISLSFDFIMHKNILDYWLSNGGAELNSLNFHKYDSNSLNEFTDQQIFSKVETEYFGTWPLGRSVIVSQQIYYDTRNKLLPIICSESNLNAYCSAGSDPRIVQMAGAVWSALLIRMEILNGISFTTYFTFDASKNYETNKTYGGYGFGLINSDNNQPWYPYYVYKIVGNNLAVGDSILETSSTSVNFRTIAWHNEGKLKLLLISKTNQPQSISLKGFSDQINVTKIDNSISWMTPNIQSEILNATQPLLLKGYTVALIQNI